MYKYLVIMILCAFACTIAYSQHKVVVCIGSSTTAGQGATPNPNPNNPDNPPDSCWASILSRYLRGLGLIDTLVNLGRSGTTTADGLPQPALYPDGSAVPPSTYNVTSALVRYSADVVIVNYPTNDAVLNYPLATTMANLRTIYNTVTGAGKICFITTSQPRNSATSDQQALLKVTRDSINNAFPFNVINFYNPIVAADSIHINPVYNYDNTHVNNLGHQQLFAAARDANVLSGGVPLAIVLSNLTATPEAGGVVLRWTAGNQDGPVVYTVQRSGNGTVFEDLWQEEGNSAVSPTEYSWTDERPLTGKNYYRIKISEPGAEHYSMIVAALSAEKAWGIGKIYATGKGASLSVEVRSPRSQVVTLRIVNAAGIMIASRSFAVGAPSTTVSLSVPGQAAGVYFLKVISERGETDVKSYTAF
jgi:lysophospholipase L1-like esterase